MRNKQAAAFTICVVALCVLSSCRQAENVSTQRSKKNRVIEQEAQLVDVPVPMGALPVTADAQEGLFSATSMLTYRTVQTSDWLVTFYRQEMERLGWQHGARFSGVEQLLYFEKPGRFCIISIRPSVKHTYLLVITTGRKELGYS